MDEIGIFNEGVKTTNRVLARLEKKFAHLSDEERTDVAAKMGMTEGQFEVWLKNDPPVIGDDLHKAALIFFLTENPSFASRVIGFNGIVEISSRAQLNPSAEDLPEYRAYVADLHTAPPDDPSS